LIKETISPKVNQPRKINAELMTAYELCGIRGYYLRDYESPNMHPTEMMRRAIAFALTQDDGVPGELAGEEVIRLASQYYLDVKDQSRSYDIALHHACLADIVTTWLVREFPGRWRLPADKVVGNLSWDSVSLVTANSELFRVILVDHLSDDRTAAESRSWYTLGDVAVYNRPMFLMFISLGNSQGGKRHSAWSKGLLHPRNRKVRFRPRQSKVAGFKESWQKIWREDHAQISREEWLSAMDDDGVINDLTFRAHVDVIESERRQHLLSLLQRRSTQLASLTSLPDPSYSACDWPRPCPLRGVCFAPVEVTPADLGFLKREA